MWDNDGDFLLIEAAYALPKWLKPDTARNRVWLAGGAVHIVPLPAGPGSGLPAAPSIAEALGIVASDAVPTLPGASVQVTLWLTSHRAYTHHSCRALCTLASASRTGTKQQMCPVDDFHTNSSLEQRCNGCTCCGCTGGAATAGDRFRRRQRAADALRVGHAAGVSGHAAGA